MCRRDPQPSHSWEPLQRPLSALEENALKAFGCDDVNSVTAWCRAEICGITYTPESYNKMKKRSDASVAFTLKEQPTIVMLPFIA